MGGIPSFRSCDDPDWVERAGSLLGSFGSYMIKFGGRTALHILLLLGVLHGVHRLEGSGAERGNCHFSSDIYGEDESLELPEFSRFCRVWR